MTTTSEVDWDEYGELLGESGAAYQAVLEARNPISGRVYPSKVAAAERVWHEAYERRMAVAKQLGAQLGVPSHEVTVMYYRHRLEKSKEEKKNGSR